MVKPQVTSAESMFHTFTLSFSDTVQKHTGDSSTVFVFSFVVYVHVNRQQQRVNRQEIREINAMLYFRF